MVAVVVVVVAARLQLMLPLFTAAADTGVGGGSNCTRWCGNIAIPYPFGIEDGCYHPGGGFNLTCSIHDDGGRHSHHNPKLFLGDGTVQVLEISIPNATVRISSSGVIFADSDSVNQQQQQPAVNKTWGAGLPRPGPYYLSEQYGNMLRMEQSCDVQVNLLANGSSLVASCTAICPTVGSGRGGIFEDGRCAGIGCCQASIDIGYSFYTIQLVQRPNSGLLLPDGNGSSISGLVYITEQDFNFSRSEGDYSADPPEAVSATLSWSINSNLTCPPSNISAPECRSTNTSCIDNQNFMGIGAGYTCQCSPGYQGNPYIDDGCKDIDECKSPESYSCYGNCTNTPGNFTCLCPTGYRGNAYVPNGCKDINECENPEAYSCYGICENFPGTFRCQCPKETYGSPFIKDGCVTIERKNSYTGLSTGLGVGGGTSLLLLVVGGPHIMRKIKLQKVTKMKHKFFKQNHGLLLQQLISRNTDIGERMIITLRDIEKATNNFDRARIIGGGGHGVVFKGILDLQVVAIKKSKIVVQREINEFINEVAVLSQVNHRNVVKLLGCCLETEVPLLVYEFISNGTLCHHLHIDGPISLPWDDRIRIASEVAKALSYLHSAASMPIFLRDIKSTNILLDDALTTKVSDFGASRYIPIDQTGVTTVVHGTMGYLDPMYYYTCRLTDKSDVFSFVLLLVELLTHKKPYVYRSDDNDGLVSHFVSLHAEGKLVDIIDPQVTEEEGGEIQEVATLAVMCTKLKGEDRPTMREVEMTLESLLVKKRQVQCDGTPMSRGGDEVASHYMATVRDCKEASRQYTMEEEILLSASYPR